MTNPLLAVPGDIHRSTPTEAFHRGVGAALRAAREAYRPKVHGDACCGLAQRSTRGCVCLMVIDCPLHGETHIGTHD